MKKYTLFAIAITLCCLIVSCGTIMAHAVGMTQEDKAYRIVPKNIGENRAVAVFYGPEYLKEQEDKRAGKEMREPNYEYIKEHGYIQVRTQAWTAGTANQKNWLFIVLDADKTEVYRSYGESSRPVKQDTTYWNLHDIYLEEEYKFPLYLRVVTAYGKTAIDIVIEKK